MEVAPSALVDVIESTPAIDENCFSSGVATDEAMVSGLAPGRPAVTLIVGKSTFGRSLTGSDRYERMPNPRMPPITSVVVTARRMKNSGMVIVRRLLHWESSPPAPELWEPAG